MYDMTLARCVVGSVGVNHKPDLWGSLPFSSYFLPFSSPPSSPLLFLFSQSSALSITFSFLRNLSLLIFSPFFSSRVLLRLAGLVFMIRRAFERLHAGHVQAPNAQIALSQRRGLGNAPWPVGYRSVMWYFNRVLSCRSPGPRAPARPTAVL